MLSDYQKFQASSRPLFIEMKGPRTHSRTTKWLRCQACTLGKLWTAATRAAHAKAHVRKGEAFEGRTGYPHSRLDFRLPPTKAELEVAERQAEERSRRHQSGLALANLQHAVERAEQEVVEAMRRNPAVPLTAMSSEMLAFVERLRRALLDADAALERSHG